MSIVAQEAKNEAPALKPTSKRSNGKAKEIVEPATKKKPIPPTKSKGVVMAAPAMSVPAMMEP